MKKTNNIDPHNKIDLCSYIKGFILAIYFPVWLLISPFLLYYSSIQIQKINTSPDLPLTYVFALVVIYLASLAGSVIDIIVIVAFICDVFTGKMKIGKPTIFIEYIKTMRKKICPVIEFINE